jgi:DNA-binding MarR family transcriptional regulator
MCASFRRVSRALTQRYDAALRPLGLSITQFTILQALSLTQQASQGQLSEILSMDSTTLTRTLAIMHTHGWIDKREGTDHRQRLLGLTPAGKSEFNRALPHWRKAQAQLRTKLGKKLWDSLTSQVNTLTAAVAE